MSKKKLDRFIVDTTDAAIVGHWGGKCSGCGIRYYSVRCRVGKDGAYYTTERNIQTSAVPIIIVGHRIDPTDVLSVTSADNVRNDDLSIMNHARLCYLKNQT